MNWTTATTSASTSVNWILMPATYWPGGPAPRPKTALDWLDDEIEATCKLARQAG